MVRHHMQASWLEFVLDREIVLKIRWEQIWRKFVLKKERVLKIKQEITDIEIKDMHSDEKISLHKEMAEIACGEYFVCLSLKQADRVRLSELKKILANGHLNPNASDCHYPKTLQDALHLVKGYTNIASKKRTTVITMATTSREWSLWSMISPT